MTDRGSIISKNLGNASVVSKKKELPDDPEFITISKNFSDCVRNITNASIMAMNAVAMNRFFSK